MNPGTDASLPQAIQVLIVDDSAVVRGLLVRALEADPEIAVAGTAMHGEAALRALRRQPADVVILDVEMPVMDGLTALPLILQEFPDTRVIMASSLTLDGAETTVRALALGAAGCVAKPTASSISQSIDQLTRDLLPLVKALGKRSAPPSRLPPPGWQPPRTPRVSVAPDVIVIGSSTGGPNALSRVVSNLPETVTCPILIVQHMPATFTPMLARHLGNDSGRPCEEGRHGQPVRPGTITVAPGDHHLSLIRIGNQLHVEIDQNPPEHFCRPSVNPLFRTAASQCGPRVLAIMLTGMGEDGIEGTRAVAAAGGTIIAQDEATSVVWGMPRAVVRESLAHHVLPLDDVAPLVGSLCSRSARVHPARPCKEVEPAPRA